MQEELLLISKYLAKVLQVEPPNEIVLKLLRVSDVWNEVELRQRNKIIYELSMHANCR